MDLNLQSFTITGFFSLIFIYFALLIRTKIAPTSSTREAPEPAGAWPIIGHLHHLGGSNQHLHQTLGNMADKYGPAFCIRLGNFRAFVASSREVAKECFTTNDRAFSSRPVTAATKHMCYNNAVFGFAPYSQHWREMRKIVMLELLSNSRLEAIKNVQASEVDAGIRKLYCLWAENKSRTPVLVELNQWLEDITFNVIVRVVAGKRYTAGASHDGESRRCQNAIAEFFRLMGIFVVSDAFPFLRWLDFQGHEKAMKKTANELDAILGGWLEEHRQRKVSGHVSADVDEQDFIDRMLSAEERGHLSGFPFDADTSIKSTCLAVITGASDATATTLTWAVSLLLNDQFALKKAQEELDLHVGAERLVDESDIKNLAYLQAIIKETLRLNPVAPLSGPREAMEDCTLAGYNVPACSRLIINVWKIQRDPTIWTDPLEFQPERFLTRHVDVDVRGQHFELIPFGSGRRACPGVAFALQGLHLTLARLLQAFDLANSNDEPVDMAAKSGMNTAKATPLEVLVSPRLPARLYSIVKD